jgi:NADP-dependent 3-hydroxy acid dehydrogenase YdfG
MQEALIWGASGGIGSALVQVLKTAGWTVFGAARQEAQIPREADHTHSFEAANLRSIQGIPPLIAPESEGLDLVVYAAGALRNGKLDAQSAEDWAVVMDSNLHGAFYAIQASLPLLKPGGHVVVIGAYIDHLILPKMGAYAAAKAALDPLIGVLRREQRQMKFTIVRPGPVNTAFWAQAPFRLPQDAKPPVVVAEAILAHVVAGRTDDLNL